MTLVNSERPRLIAFYLRGLRGWRRPEIFLALLPIAALHRAWRSHVCGRVRELALTSSSSGASVRLAIVFTQRLRQLSPAKASW